MEITLMGKTSLITNISDRLTQAGFNPIYLSFELADRATHLTNFNKFLRWFCLNITKQLGLANELDEYWDKEGMGAKVSCTTYFEEYLLADTNLPLFLCLDDVDLLFPYPEIYEDFFGLLRSWYEKARSRKLWQKLRLAIAHSTEVYIRLNINQSFLTQKLCLLGTQKLDNLQQGKNVWNQNSKQFVTQLVRSRILDNWEAQDEPEHLRTVRDRILRNSRSSLNLLKLYQKILQKKKIKVKNCQEHLELRLSGLVTQDSGYLVVKNPIYQAVFNSNWVRQQLNQLQPNISVLPIWTVTVASVLVTSILLIVRSLGWLQPWELQSFDWLMRLRPNEGLDQRLLLVTITEADVQSQPIAERGAASLSNQSLNLLLAKLEQAQPRAIGLDIYREAPLKMAHRELAERMSNSDRLFAICSYGNPGVHPPPEVPPTHQGFNNVRLDADRTLRRHLLAVSSSSPCQSKYAFSWQLATHYLAEAGIEPQTSPENHLQLGNTVFKTLETNTAGYHNLDASGHQILLNYRHTPQIAQTVTLQNLLSDRFLAELAKDRMVLIGTTAPSFNDHNWRTPYSTGTGQYKL